MFQAATLIGIMALGQTVEFSRFSDRTRYIQTTGTSAEIAAFYQEWKRNIDPNWQKNAETWWKKSDAMILMGLRFPRKNADLLYDISNNRQRWAFFKTMCQRNCTLRIHGSLDPFGQFTLNFSPRIVAFVLIGIFVMDLIGFIFLLRHWWNRRKGAKNGR